MVFLAEVTQLELYLLRSYAVLPALPLSDCHLTLYVCMQMSASHTKTKRKRQSYLKYISRYLSTLQIAAQPTIFFLNYSSFFLSPSIVTDFSLLFVGARMRVSVCGSVLSVFIGGGGVCMQYQRLGKVEGGKDLYIMYIFAYVCI